MSKITFKNPKKDAKQVLFGDAFVRLCESVQDKGKLISLSDASDRSKLSEYMGKNPNADWYVSLYNYDEKAYKYWKENQGIAGYKGDVFSKVLFFDFDCKAEPAKAQEDTLQLLRKLKGFGIDVSKSCKVYFSGNKGFHVEVQTSREFYPDQLKMYCVALAEEFESFDNVVYNTNRIIRLVDTKHQTTGLYKIQLNPNDLKNLSIEEIKEKAKLPGDFTNDTEAVKDLSFLSTLPIKPKHSPKPKSVIVGDEGDFRGIDEVDFAKMPRNMPRCIYTLTHGVMPTGQGVRSELFLRLATYYRNQGMTKRNCHGTLKGIAESNALLYPEHEKMDKDEIWNTVINSAYNGAFKQVPGATGISKDNEMLKSCCEGLDAYTEKACTLHSEKENISKPVKISEVFDSFRNFAENFDKNTVKTGVRFIDEHMNIAVGTTTLLVGASGSGKTTLGLNIMENANANDLHTMFFSMDMHKNLVYLKLAQKLCNYSQKEILQIYKNKDANKIELIRRKIAEKYGKTFFDFTSAMTMEQMRDKVFETEQQSGHKVKLVVVDYASRIVSDKSDSYANARYNAIKSTEVANVTDAAWMYVSQVSRNTGDGSTPIRTKRAAKDSGDWEETATNVITCWRPFMGDAQRDDVMRLFMAKNRMGRELEQVLHWDGAKGVVRDMSDDELAIYDETRGADAEKQYLKDKYSAKTGKDK